MRTDPAPLPNEPEPVCTATLRTMIRAWLLWSHNQGHAAPSTYHQIRRLLEDELAKDAGPQP